METREGFYYGSDRAVHQGLECPGVVIPRRNTTSPVEEPFDVIVVGAGYAGLTSCRDLCSSGFRVLLLEARDRIGGRAYTARVDGHLYEMGGTWIHWNQPHTYREVSRYGLTELKSSKDESVGCNYSTLSADDSSRQIDNDKMNKMVAKAFTELCDVDGQCGRRVMPFPHTPYQDAKVRMWEISVAERLDHIRSKLNHDEMTLLQAFIAAISGNDMETVGFFDVLRWWALSGYNADGLYELTETFKVRSQSEFAQCFFNEACSTRSFSYSFSTLVKAVKHHGDTVVAHDHSGGIWRARRLICTLPLNVLHETEFEPPLPPNKLSISKKGHINEGAKVHMEVQGRELRSWSVAAWPSSRVFSGRGDGLTPAGNTHVVFFGANKRFRHAQEDAQDFEAAAKKLHAMDVKKVIWHNWLTDPLSRGSWCMFPPNISLESLSVLRERHGRVLFASGDWAFGWRGFIDGAIEQGAKAAKTVADEFGYRRRRTVSSL